MTVSLKVLDAQSPDEQIHHIAADAMLMTVDPAGNWTGAIDEGYRLGLQRGYLAELYKARPLQHGDVIIASGEPYLAPAFEKVIFMVDESTMEDAKKRPLDLLVGSALRSAEFAGMAKITLPLMRTEWQFGTEDALAAMARAIAIFIDHRPQSVREITVVVHRDHAAAEALKEKFERADYIDRLAK